MMKKAADQTIRLRKFHQLEKANMECIWTNWRRSWERRVLQQPPLEPKLLIPSLVLVNNSKKLGLLLASPIHRDSTVPWEDPKILWSSRITVLLNLNSRSPRNTRKSLEESGLQVSNLTNYRSKTRPFKRCLTERRLPKIWIPQEAKQPLSFPREADVVFQVPASLGSKWCCPSSRSWELPFFNSRNQVWDLVAFLNSKALDPILERSTLPLKLAAKVLSMESIQVLLLN